MNGFSFSSSYIYTPSDLCTQDTQEYINDILTQSSQVLIDLDKEPIETAEDYHIHLTEVYKIDNAEQKLNYNIKKAQIEQNHLIKCKERIIIARDATIKLSEVRGYANNKPGTKPKSHSKKAETQPPQKGGFKTVVKATDDSTKNKTDENKSDKDKDKDKENVVDQVDLMMDREQIQIVSRFKELKLLLSTIDENERNLIKAMETVRDRWYDNNDQVSNDPWAPNDDFEETQRNISDWIKNFNQEIAFLQDTIVYSTELRDHVDTVIRQQYILSQKCFDNVRKAYEKRIIDLNQHKKMLEDQKESQSEIIQKLENKIEEIRKLLQQTNSDKGVSGGKIKRAALDKVSSGTELLQKLEESKKELNANRQKMAYIKQRIALKKKILGKDRKLLNREGRVVIPFPNEMLLMGFLDNIEGRR